MANEEQVAILKQGAKVWNKWRKDNPEVKIDLKGVNLGGVMPIHTDLRDYLQGIDLRKADLEAADLSGAILVLADLQGSNLREANLREAHLEAADLSDADLTKANLRDAYLFTTIFAGARLRLADLRNAGCYHTVFDYADLEFAVLKEAILHGAKFNRTLLRQTNFQDTKLTGANFYSTNFLGCDLERADLTSASFFGAWFSGTIFHQVILNEAIFGATVFGEIDLSETISLEATRHIAPSIIDLGTLKLSKGKIPEKFLRGCGFNDLDIEYAKLADPSLDPDQVTDITYKINQLYIGGSIKYYSCFISYSSKDQEFAYRLHDNLQDNGVRCWFDREDLKVGDAIRPVIDRQIRLRDKLLVILSENSLKSEWVGDEVEAALEEESKGDRLLLIPIRLDDTILKTREDWAAKIKRRRHIGDFSNWKDKASYQKAFERLLRDLEATG